MNTSRARVHRSDGLPFAVLVEPKGTGLYAEWADDGTLKALRYLHRGRVLPDGDEVREIVFETETDVRSFGGVSWSDGRDWQSYAQAFESYNGTPMKLMDWLIREAARLSEPTRAEVRIARGLRTFAGLVFAGVGTWQLLENWQRLGGFVTGIAMCVVPVLLLFGPNMLPLRIRGHRVQGNLHE